MVNAVWCGSVLFSTIGPRSSSSQRSSGRGTQIRPRPCIAMKFTVSADMFSAIAIKSPSFSLFSSSTTITNLPSDKSSIAFCIVLNSELIYYFGLWVAKFQFLLCECTSLNLRIRLYSSMKSRKWISFDEKET